MKTTLHRDSGSTELDFSEGVVFLEGEFAGNIDLIVESTPPLGTRDLLRSLMLEVPGETRCIEAPDEQFGHFDLVAAPSVPHSPHPFDDREVRTKANLRGVLTLIGLFPEVREWLASLFAG